jgi:hypothetical protein
MKPKKWWDAHLYLAGEIAECANELAKHQHGYPGTFDKKSKDGKHHYSKRNDKRWHDILITIRDGFKLWRDSDGDFYEWKDGKTPPPMEFIKQPDGTSISKPRPPGFKLIVNKKKEKKFKEAMRLFAEHFEHLWD